MVGKSKSKTSWREKLEKEHPSHGKIVEIPAKAEKIWGKGTMLIPKPLNIDALIRSIPIGHLITQSQLREKLAKDSRADKTCPITTGIFLRIVAEASEEDLKLGKQNVTPYWRVIGNDGSLSEKFPGGINGHKEKIEKEGYAIVSGKGKKPRVKDFTNYLYSL